MPNRTLPRPARAPRGLAVALAVATLAVGCGRSSPGPAAGSSTPCSPGAPALLPCSASALPAFDLATFQQLLGELKGRPVLVNIWASWCAPCIQEAPALARLQDEYAGRVQFLGVDILDQLSLARAFIAKYGWTYPSVFDPRGAIRDGLLYVGQPITIVYDRSGAKSFELSGPIDEATLARELRKVAG